MTRPEDKLELPADDFRRLRSYLAPHVFYPYEEGTYPPASDLIERDAWEHVMDLATDVALKTTSYSGSVADRLQELESDWIFSWPEPDQAPFVGEVCVLAGEEFDALVFNGIHGYYRQAIGCLRNALETMTVAAGLAVTQNKALFEKWRAGQEIKFGQARAWLRDSSDGTKLEQESAPESIFGDASSAWMKSRYATLCGYAHSRSGYNNVDFWDSNGPVYRPRALGVVEEEFRETLALSYLLLRLAWPDYSSGQGQPKLLAGKQGNWAKFGGLLQRWLV